MIFTEIAKREIMEMRQANDDRIVRFGVHPLCEKCPWECKVAKAKGLINFWCRNFEER